jgi:hypothetical protein
MTELVDNPFRKASAIPWGVLTAALVWAAIWAAIGGLFLRAVEPVRFPSRRNPVPVPE